MLDFLVLGLVPGTNIQITFDFYVRVALFLSVFPLGYIIMSYADELRFEFYKWYLYTLGKML